MSDEQTEGSQLRENLDSALAENRAKDIQIAVLQAGVDTSTPLGAMFAENLKQRENLDPEAISTEWAALNGAPSQEEATPPATPPAQDPTLAAVMPTEPAVPGVSAEALESLQLSEVAASAPQVPPLQREDLTAHQAAALAQEEARAEGRDSTTQNAAYYGTLLSRAAGNDPTAIWTPEKWQEHLADHGELPL